MSLFNVFNIAASGMSAQSTRLNLVSSNMANVDTVSSSTEATYHSRQPVFQTLLNEANPKDTAVGVRVAGIVESKTPLRKEYQPAHPLADKDGYIFRPNVDMVEEMANMISASRTYQSNVEVVNTARQMLTATLRIGE